MIEWHRLLELCLKDYFTGTAYKVDSEIDLSLNKQYLDLLVIEESKEAPPVEDICDGFENLNKYNVITYKSISESLNIWAVEELVGHYVNCRKQISKDITKKKQSLSGKTKGEKVKLVPWEEFQLYGICTHYPKKLLEGNQSRQIKKGVIDKQRKTLFGNCSVESPKKCNMELASINGTIQK